MPEDEKHTLLENIEIEVEEEEEEEEKKPWGRLLEGKIMEALSGQRKHLSL